MSCTRENPVQNWRSAPLDGNRGRVPLMKRNQLVDGKLKSRNVTKFEELANKIKRLPKRCKVIIWAPVCKNENYFWSQQSKLSGTIWQQGEKFVDATRLRASKNQTIHFGNKSTESEIHSLLVHQTVCGSSDDQTREKSLVIWNRWYTVWDIERVHWWKWRTSLCSFLKWISDRCNTLRDVCVRKSAMYSLANK